ncbi:MAG: phosphate acyltransferase [Candidatus Omnitrophica bacterium]|nr:phosphate acyltransferase [Candidatus Omnitrophota bacterium]MDD5573798.1 phosphate acyltransferase [Candidatus Omnitrophota bacterium]
MDAIALIREKAKKQSKTIVLPEGHDPRVRRAAEFLEKEGIAKVVLLEKGRLDPKKIEEYTESYYQLRQHKGISREEAQQTVSQPVFYGALMVRQGLADGFVAGADTTTPDVAKAGLYCLGVDRRIATISSCFIMTVPNSSYGEGGTFLFADCGIIPDPTTRQMAQIALSTADLGRKVLGITPKVAMLSYSTKGSATGRFVERIREATAMLHEMAPDLLVDGELQVDAAIVPEVAKHKNPGSPIQGDANILLFPNLEAGNIAYKLVERLANGRALGPLLMGLVKPCSDLSRGCSWEDVVDCTAVTAIRCQYAVEGEGI